LFTPVYFQFLHTWVTFFFNISISLLPIKKMGQQKINYWTIIYLPIIYLPIYRKIHLVNWSKVCRPMKNGGLGIQRLRRFNSALLEKWLWRYGLENDSLWRSVIEAKYGNEWGGWCTKFVSRAYGVCLWKFIRSG